MGLSNRIDRMCIEIYLKVLRTSIEEFNKAKLGSDHYKDWTKEQVRELKQVTAETALEQIDHLKGTDKAAALTVMLLYHDDIVEIKKFLKEIEL